MSPIFQWPFKYYLAIPWSIPLESISTIVHQHIHQSIRYLILSRVLLSHEISIVHLVHPSLTQNSLRLQWGVSLTAARRPLAEKTSMSSRAPRSWSKRGFESERHGKNCPSDFWATKAPDLRKTWEKHQNWLLQTKTAPDFWAQAIFGCQFQGPISGATTPPHRWKTAGPGRFCLANSSSLRPPRPSRSPSASTRRAMMGWKSISFTEEKGGNAHDPNFLPAILRFGRDYGGLPHYKLMPSFMPMM